MVSHQELKRFYEILSKKKNRLKTNKVFKFMKLETHSNL